ncbi:hypothetical protein D3C81_1530310 [compost metagenome]
MPFTRIEAHVDGAAAGQGQAAAVGQGVRLPLPRGAAQVGQQVGGALAEDQCAGQHQHGHGAGRGQLAQTLALGRDGGQCGARGAMVAAGRLAHGMQLAQQVFHAGGHCRVQRIGRLPRGEAGPCLVALGRVVRAQPHDPAGSLLGGDIGARAAHAAMAGQAWRQASKACTRYFCTMRVETFSCAATAACGCSSR